jgi:hypothetical protein
MAGLATDPAAAMQLFLMNPQQQQQQQSRSSPTSPPPSDVQHHEAFQAFGAAAGAAFGGAGTTGVVEGQGLSLFLEAIRSDFQRLGLDKCIVQNHTENGIADGTIFRIKILLFNARFSFLIAKSIS